MSMWKTILLPRVSLMNKLNKFSDFPFCDEIDDWLKDVLTYCSSTR